MTRSEKARQPEKARDGVALGKIAPFAETTQGRQGKQGKTERAWRAYLDVMDAAALLEDWMGRHLEGYGLTMAEFRFAELLYREGPMRMAAAGEKLGVSRSSIADVVWRFEKSGMVRREKAELPPVESARYEREARRKGVKRRRGRRVSVVGLTAKGKRIMAEFLPRHEKWVVSTMRALRGQEQATLSRLCEKLRERYMEKWFYGMKARG